MLEHRAREHEIERVVGPGNLSHRSPATVTARHRVEAEALEVGGRTQLDVVLHLVAEGIAKSGVQEFVGLRARAASEVENHAVGCEGPAAGGKDPAVKPDHPLGSLVFLHGARRMMEQKAPALAAGACGSRRSRQSAAASGVSIELSCTGAGVA